MDNPHQPKSAFQKVKLNYKKCHKWTYKSLHIYVEIIYFKLRKKYFENTKIDSKFKKKLKPKGKNITFYFFLIQKL